MIGQEIKNARLKLGISQAKLGKMIGVSKVAICWYEKGDRKPSLDNFIKLAEVLNLPFDFVLGKDKEVDGVKDEEKYTVKLASKDLEIINELKQYPSLYKKIYEDPKRTIKLINMKLK